MWYVMQVRTGTEESIRVQCQSNIPAGVLERCFIPYYEERKHIRGTWITQKKVLFPGYVFVVTDKLDQLYESLRTVIGLTKLIGTGRDIVPLTDQEKHFLLEFGGEGIVRVNGKIISAITSYLEPRDATRTRVMLSESAKAGETYQVEIEAH